MRKRIISLLALVIASPAAGQEPPRRTDEARALRALLEAQVRSLNSVEAQRALLETQRTALLAQAAGLEGRVGLERALEMQVAALEPLHTQLALLEAHLTTAAHQTRVVDAQRARLEAALSEGYADELAPDADFEAVLDAIAERGIPEAWAPQDPADSLYRVGREQLNSGEYRAAARTFERIRSESRFARSQYLPAAYYWQAFALSRTGSTDDLRQAREILRDMLRSFVSDAPQVGDVPALAAAIDARLARNGDEHARVLLARAAQQDISRTTQSLQNAQRSRTTTLSRQQCEDDDIRSVALNALLQMESEQAVPILREVMARRDACSVQLRRRAMMMLAQQHDAAAQSILIEAALADPDPEVREQATFWLAQVPGDAAVEALARILTESPTPAVQQRALFALGQQPGERSAAILRDYALRTDVPEELRRHIVFSLAHTNNAANASFLRQLYDRTSDRDMKRQIVMTLSHNPSPEIAQWLLGIATNPDEPVEVRRHALLMAANTPGIDSDGLISLYDDAGDADMRRHIILVLGQRVHSDPAAVGKLVEIARTTNDVELQKMVVYMLSESRDPRVVELMAELVRRPIR